MRAECLCGDIQIEIGGKVGPIVYCHCSRSGSLLASEGVGLGDPVSGWLAQLKPMSVMRPENTDAERGNLSLRRRFYATICEAVAGLRVQLLNLSPSRRPLGLLPL